MPARAESESAVAVVRQVFEEVLNQRDATALEPFWAEDIVQEFPDVVLRGREALRGYFADVFRAFPDYHIEASHIVGAGETVFAAWRITGTFSGTRWMGLEPTGTALVLHGTDRFTIRDGRIAHNVVTYDRLSFAQQLGLVPADGSAGEKLLRAGFNGRTRAKRMLGRRPDHA